MNRQYGIVIAVLVALLVIGGGAYFLTKNHTSNSSQSYTPTSSPTASPSPSSSSSTSSNTPKETDKVTIANMAFSPAAITVKAGTTVTWTNNDSVGHNVIETDGQSGPSSSLLSNGASYTFTFAKAGTYHYHCSIHPNMTGTVTVTQ